MNSYHGGVTESGEWQPLQSTLSYHATLGDHHHSPHHHGHSHPHGHNHSHGTSSHPHTYPSQHLPTAIVDHGHVAPLMESPSYSQDRESLHSSEHDDRDDTASSTPRSNMPHIPTYQLSSMCPLPSQTTGFKRSYQADIITPTSSPQPSKRRKSTSKEAWSMTEDDNLLLKLKDEEGLPWKVIASRFRDMNRGEFRVPTLQMRYKRLKEKMRVWDPEDIQYLKEAREIVEKQKWELISQKMLDLGCKKKIPGSTCEKKWKEISPQPINTQSIPGASGPNSASTNSAISTTSDGLMQACEMKRDLSQVSEEEELEGLNIKLERE